MFHTAYGTNLNPFYSMGYYIITYPPAFGNSTQQIRMRF